MTTDLKIPIRTHIVAGTGPYAVPWPYGEGELLVWADLDGDITPLTNPAQWTASPTSTMAGGEITLAGAVATSFAGAQLVIERATVQEQGWQGVQGREIGLTVALDRTMRAVQDLKGQSGGMLRILGKTDLVPIAEPVEGSVVIWDGDKFAPGPTADEVARAQGHSQDAAEWAGKAQEFADRVDLGELDAAKVATAEDRTQTGLDVLATASDRAQTGSDVIAAAAVLDGTVAAAASIGMYADATLAAAVAAGLAVATEGQTFHATGLNVDYVGVYKDVSGVAVEQAKLPKSSALTAANRARYAGSVSGNLLRWSGAAVADWIKSTALATFEGSTASDGAFAFRLAHTSAANVSRNIKREAGQTSLSYRLQLDSKTGGTGGSPGRVLIQEIEEPQGAGASGFTVLATTTIVLPSGTVSVPVPYQGTIALNAATKRLVFVVDLQGATEIVFTEPVLAWGAFPGLILPRADPSRELDGASWPMAQGFDPLRVTGAFFGMTGAVSGTSRYYVNDDGDIQITTGENSIRLWRDGKSVHDKSAFEVSLAATVTGGDTGAGALIGIGDIDGTGAGARKIYGYLRNGFIGVLDNNNATVVGGAVAGMTYADGERVSLRLFRSSDGSGYIEATSPAGTKSRLAVAGIPSGSVAAAWRRATTGLIHRLNVLPVSAAMPDIERRVEAIESIVGGGAVSLLGYTVLPNYPDDRDTALYGFGFTCTGLDRWPVGTTFAGCWLVGDDGRMVEGDGTPLAGKAHVLSPDKRLILCSYDFGLTESVQGVACCPDDTFWIMHSTLGQARHYDLSGAEISADRITWSALGYTGIPNGMAYDPVLDALWITTSALALARLIKCSDRSLLTSTMLGSSSPDQLHLDQPNGLLYYSTGGNGSNGTVGIHRLSVGADIGSYGPLPLTQAPEGVYVDRVTGIMTLTNDGQFHNVARPALNTMPEYRVPLAG